MDYNRNKTIDDNENQLNSYKKNEKKMKYLKKTEYTEILSLPTLDFPSCPSFSWESEANKIKSIKEEPKEKRWNQDFIQSQHLRIQWGNQKSRSTT